MKNILKKVALVSAFVMTLCVGATIGVNFDGINDYSITANAENTTYTVQDIATIQDDEDFKTSSFFSCSDGSYCKMTLNQNTNILYYVDDTKVYEYNIYTAELKCILDTADMSLKMEGTTSYLTDFIIDKVITNPYNNHVYVTGYFPDSSAVHHCKNDYIYDITTQTYYNTCDSYGDWGITRERQTYFYDENTLYAYDDSDNVWKYDFTRNEYVKNANLSIMKANQYSSFHSIFERDNGFYYMDKEYGNMYIYYVGIFANENPNLLLTITDEDFENYSYSPNNCFSYLNIHTIYNSEPYILDYTCGDIYKVDIDNQELVKYIDGNEVVQTGRTYFSENICNLLMSKDGEPIFYDWKDHTIKIFKSDTAPTMPPDEPSNPAGEYSRFDVNRDGSVNILDLIELKQYILGLITE